MICSIFSIDQVGGMGLRGSMPWSHHPEDMSWFRELTLEHVVVMGRKTWDDPKMPKPLERRINYVVTNRPVMTRGVHTLSGDWIPKLQEIAELHQRKVFILGGPDLIAEAKPVTDFAYVTHRKGNWRCDTRLDMGDFVVKMRTISSRPSTDNLLNFCIYKNIESQLPLYEGLS